LSQKEINNKSDDFGHQIIHSFNKELNVKNQNQNKHQEKNYKNRLKINRKKINNFNDDSNIKNKYDELRNLEFSNKYKIFNFKSIDFHKLKFKDDYLDFENKGIIEEKPSIHKTYLNKSNKYKKKILQDYLNISSDNNKSFENQLSKRNYKKFTNFCNDNKINYLKELRGDTNTIKNSFYNNYSLEIEKFKENYVNFEIESTNNFTINNFNLNLLDEFSPEDLINLKKLGKNKFRKLLEDQEEIEECINFFESNLKFDLFENFNTDISKPRTLLNIASRCNYIKQVLNKNSDGNKFYPYNITNQYNKNEIINVNNSQNFFFGSYGNIDINKQIEISNLNLIKKSTLEKKQNNLGNIDSPAEKFVNNENSPGNIINYSLMNISKLSPNSRLEKIRENHKKQKNYFKQSNSIEGDIKSINIKKKNSKNAINHIDFREIKVLKSSKNKNPNPKGKYSNTDSLIEEFITKSDRKKTNEEQIKGKNFKYFSKNKEFKNRSNSIIYSSINNNTQNKSIKPKILIDKVDNKNENKYSKDSFVNKFIKSNEESNLLNNLLKFKETSELSRNNSIEASSRSNYFKKYLDSSASIIENKKNKLLLDKILSESNKNENFKNNIGDKSKNKHFQNQNLKIIGNNQMKQTEVLEKINDFNSLSEIHNNINLKLDSILNDLENLHSINSNKK